eukprot:7387846-Prymnesium_polylepis.1
MAMAKPGVGGLLFLLDAVLAKKKAAPVVEEVTGYDPKPAVYCATALLVLSLLLQMTMSFGFNGPAVKAKTDEEFKKIRDDAAFNDPVYWKMSRTQMNISEYVPTMAALMYYLFSVYKGGSLPNFAAYSCLTATMGTFVFAIGYATQKGTIWGHSLKPPFVPPPLRAIGTMVRYAGLGMLIYAAYAASV